MDSLVVVVAVVVAVVVVSGNGNGGDLLARKLARTQSAF